MIAALFAEAGGCYYGLPHVDPWDIARDARAYSGPHPVVAHPPCQLWGRFAKINFSRWGGDHNRPGNDGGCFASALASVRKWGGVLEHPAGSYAWAAHEWVCEVWQSAYGHRCNKRTWLFYCGPPPPEMDWQRPLGTHQIGGHDQRGPAANKPSLFGRAARATPPAFRDALLSLAASSARIERAT